MLRYASIRFLLVGLFNTAITVLVYRSLIGFVPYIWAYSIGYVLGIVSSYLLNSLWVFRAKLSWRRFLAFPAVYVVQYAIGSLAIVGCVRWFGVSEEFAILPTLVVTVPLGFFLSKCILTAVR